MFAIKISFRRRNTSSFLDNCGSEYTELRCSRLHVPSAALSTYKPRRIPVIRRPRLSQPGENIFPSLVTPRSSTLRFMASSHFVCNCMTSVVSRSKIASHCVRNFLRRRCSLSPFRATMAAIPKGHAYVVLARKCAAGSQYYCSLGTCTQQILQRVLTQQ